jgi:FkbM family methyltransferase
MYALAATIVRKPQYFLRPDQLPRRLASRSADEVILPWGLPLGFDPSEVHGSALRRMRVFDLPMTEALFRLTGPGDHCLDVGANIGYATSILAFRAGVGGRVTAFEPSPLVLPLLRRNISLWSGKAAAGVVLVEAAVSVGDGTRDLAMPFQTGVTNNGTATLEAVNEAAQHIPVRTVKLDSVCAGPVHVMKLDVEGHEAEVLAGAKATLTGGGVQHIVFEEHRRPPTPVTDQLSAAGYTIFRIDQGSRGPRLVRDLTAPSDVRYDPVNYLASLSASLVERRLGSPGWWCLRPRKRLRGK